MNLHAESPDDELTGVAAIAALQDAYAKQSSMRFRVSPNNIDVFRDGPWIAIVFRFPKGFSFTWKLSRHWAIVLKTKLEQVIKQ